MKVLKIGVIGIGDISNAYLNNLKKFSDIVELYACACRSLEKAERKAKEHGFKKAYASGDELIADPDIDIVMNLTVPEWHYDYNLKAVKAGKHVYSEKPLAATFAQGKEIIDAAKEKGLYVGCAPDTFMGGRLQTFRRLIDEGVIGDIVGASAYTVSPGWECFHPNPDFFYQPGAGPLLDIGPYYVTALLSLLGPVDCVSAMGRQVRTVRTISSEPLKGQKIHVHPDVDTHIVANLQFKNGAIVNLGASFEVWDSELPRLEVYGTKGTIGIQESDPNAGPNLFGGDVYLRRQENARWLSMPRDDEEISREWEVVEKQHQYNATSYVVNDRGIGVVDMAQSILSGKKNRASGDMALHALEVMEGILKSAREHTYVKMTTEFGIPEAMPVSGL